ncbi:MAG: hypothetical protein EAZ45_24590 [Oscillatoriales cyanobacterium]|nr:MAG: hypothetical protein EAZ86_15675 [Oscillatoriales cyanobacterium]TAF95976.1 MAG: hypothetical protein EAZ45_24590 [Oscillatoriales cyanobacterium]TAG37604.1 MAG: hypothetical protein EAZ33_21355 [Oscillatoriales cyanobacterium]
MGCRDCRRNPVSWIVRGGSETGFLTQILASSPKLSQKPGFLDCARGLRNRVSFLNLGIFTKIIAETRFLGLCVGAQKPGFFLNLGGDAEIVAETRFLGLWGD